MSERSDTSERILDVAQRLTQTRGFNAFSYADITAEIGIKTASIHYYFPAKQDLASALLRRYTDDFETLFAQIDASGDRPRERIARFFSAVEHVLIDRGRMCLGGMMAADVVTLAPDAQARVRDFVRACEGWLAQTLAEGRATGALRFAGSPEEHARYLFAATEGGVLMATGTNDPERYRVVARHLQTELEAHMT